MAQIHALTPEGRLPTAAVAHVVELITAAAPYDSGLRDISGLLESPADWTAPGETAPSLTVTAQRVGPNVTVTIAGMRYFGTGTGSIRMLQLPSGLRPPENQYPANTLRGKGVQVRSNGLVYIYSPESIRDYVTLPFISREAPPANPPGSPA